MRKVPAIILFCVISTGALCAQTDPIRSRPKTTFDWSGFYLGAQGSFVSTDFTINNVASPAHFFNDPGDPIKISRSGFLPGAFAGLQRQFGEWVVGLEAGTAFGSHQGHLRALGPNALTNYYSSVSELANLSGRVGYSFDRVLVFGKAGISGSKLKTSADEYPDYDHFGGSSARHVGFHVGLGTEFAFTDNLIAGIDYTHHAFGSKNHYGFDNSGDVYGLYNVSMKSNVNSVNFRVYYKFDGLK
jgi:outer membrane immunogenic protein